MVIIFRMLVVIVRVAMTAHHHKHHNGAEGDESEGKQEGKVHISHLL